MDPRSFFSSSPPAVEPQTCFVLMPFADEFRPVYDAIHETLEGPDLAFSCSRADEIFGGGHIMDDVLASMARAEVIVAELTGRNPNVFYELGIAHTVKPVQTVIVITQSMEDVPFDLRQLRCIVYHPGDLSGLHRQLVDSIREVTPAGLRFTVQEGQTFAFRRRLPGPDRCLYDFDLGPVYLGLDFVKFMLVVRRWVAGKPAENVWSDGYGIKRGDGIEIPHAKWMLQLDRVTEQRAHFCLCEPTTRRPPARK